MAVRVKICGVTTPADAEAAVRCGADAIGLIFYGSSPRFITPARAAEEKPVKFSQLERQLKEKPDDPDLNARMAYEHFARRNYAEARPFAAFAHASDFGRGGMRIARLRLLAMRISPVAKSPI